MTVCCPNNLSERIRKDHILRKGAEKIDFDFIYKEVEETYITKEIMSLYSRLIQKCVKFYQKVE